ncbi:MAG: PD-(D/E)XK nuclease family protein [Spirosomataceae bacterium]|jgi:hypothetical protein
MDSFLKIAAKDIFSQNPLDSLRDLVIVLPSRRSVYYFKKELSQFSEKPFFLPKIIAIDDYLIEKSGLRLVDNINLYLRSFKIWQKIDPNQSIDTFLQWIPTLLKDFENIDFALVQHPHQLFKYMSEAQAIERWGLSEDFQFSDNAISYFSFFDKVAFLYEELQKDLLNDNECSRGLAYRLVSEKNEELFENTGEKHYFIGLNALSKAEEEIIRFLVKNNRAACIWDTDSFYMKSDQKAGKKLLQYKKSGNFGPWNYEFDLLGNLPKEIRIFEVPNESAQIKLVKNIIQEQTDSSQVLAVLDEAQFEPLILNLPEKNLKLNVSIGIPLSGSKVSSLVKSLISNFIDFQKSQKIHRNILIRLIEHDIFRLLLGNSYVQIEKSIKKSSKFYFSIFDFQESNHRFINLLFATGDSIKLIEVISEFLNEIIPAVIEHSLEVSFCNALIAKLSIINDELKNGFTISLNAFGILIDEMLKNEKLPFEGDQNTPLQIMSLLETRCLDFENVTLMSLNEGFLPSNTRANSFISNDAAFYFNLPQYTDQDAIMAYHFFRLLQRAQSINLIYLTGSSNEMTVKEKSRFISQIENQLKTVNDALKITYPKVSFETKVRNEIENRSILIKKQGAVLENLKTYLENNGLSPTTLNNYIDCPLKFYWLNVEKLRPENEISETIKVDTFGVILHAVLELSDFDKGLKSREKLEFNKVNLPFILEKVFTELEVKIDNKQGLNYLLKNVAEKLLEQYFDLRIANISQPYGIIANELYLESISDFYSTKVKFKGTIDKIEKHGNVIELIDFKSGEVDFNKAETKNIEEIFSEEKFGKIRQLYFYIYLVFKNLNKSDLLNFDKNQICLKSRIYSFRNLQNDYSLPEMNGDDELLFGEIENALKNIVREMLNPEKDILQTEDKKNCRFCDFKNICKRE